MADTGVKYPLTFDSITVALASAVVWATPSSILTDNAAYAGVTAASFDTGNQSRELRVRNFNISVPATASITGIIAEIERYWGAGAASDVRIILTKDGATGIGNNYATANPQAFTSAVEIKVCGSSSDLWGTTWTVSEVTSPSFGVLYRVGAGGTNTDAFLDYIRTTIYYDIPGTLWALAGISSGAATVTSNPIKRTRYISSQIAGAGTANASILRSMNIKGLISGAATSLGALNRFRSMASAVAGAATVESAVKLARSFGGTIAGVATTTTSLTVSAAVIALASIVNGIATVTASIARSLNFQSTIAGVATVTTSINRLRSMASSVAGVAAVTSGILRQRGFQVLITGVTTTSASIQRSTAFKALVSGAATVQSNLSSAGSAVGDILQKIWQLLR